MKALRAINGQEFTWDWSQLIREDAGIDPIYIETLIDQINSGMYEKLFPGIVKVIASPNYLLRNDLVFLDIGANLGLVSIYASPVCKRIVAVEPAPNVVPVLLEISKSASNIEVLQRALSTVDSEQSFFVNDINFTASSSDNTYGKQVMVMGIKLSTLLQTYDLTHVDVCKVDVEGAEGEALDYYQINNAKDIIKTYFIETHNCPKTGWEHKLGTIVGNLARCGYSKQTIDGMAITATRP